MLAYIYAIGSAGSDLIKIGWAVDPQKRLVEHQSSSAHRLRLLATYVVLGCLAKQYESGLKSLLSDRCSHGEWFHISLTEFHEAAATEGLISDVDAATALALAINAEIERLAGSSA